jgi:hypothetical protein
MNWAKQNQHDHPANQPVFKTSNIYTAINLSDNSYHSSLRRFRMTVSTAAPRFRFALSRGPRVLVPYAAYNIRFLLTVPKKRAVNFPSARRHAPHQTNTLFTALRSSVRSASRCEMPSYSCQVKMYLNIKYLACTDVSCISGLQYVTYDVICRSMWSSPICPLSYRYDRHMLLPTSRLIW